MVDLFGYFLEKQAVICKEFCVGRVEAVGQIADVDKEN